MMGVCGCVIRQLRLYLPPAAVNLTKAGVVKLCDLACVLGVI